jgi:hypothetical protein
MKKPRSIRAILLAGLLVSSSLPGAAQASRKSHVDERNVRASMQFLAGDAMQGRGSGTLFERIAAEYIASQFMQFGLEPAGEPGWDGKPSYIQTVTNTRFSFDTNPTLRTGDVTLEHSKEMLIQRINADNLVGNLQKIDIGGKASAGAAVFVRVPASGASDMNAAIQALTASGASIIMIEETPAIRGRWAAVAARTISYLVTPESGKPVAIVVLGKEAASRISALNDGTKIELAGKLAPELRQQTWNAVGKITGSDRRAAEVILLSSHFDHLGVQENAPGSDKIFNGADDDASGTVAVMELARTLAAGKRPKRTVIFACFGSEEAGGHGSRYFVNNLGFPKEQLIANLQFEMIGRPDAKVKAEELWLTGYERSNLGPELAKRGAKIVEDPHPDQNFFFRSDNITLARQGIVAHTVSSFGLHTDYHRASDELKTIDFVHMTKSIGSMIEPIDWLINSDFRPAWVEGKRP